MIKLVSTLFILIFLFIIFYPKKSMEGGLCPDCIIQTCDCIGYEKSDSTDLGFNHLCYGIVYSCEKKRAMNIHSEVSK